MSDSLVDLFTNLPTGSKPLADARSAVWNPKALTAVVRRRRKNNLARRNTPGNRHTRTLFSNPERVRKKDQSQTYRSSSIQPLQGRNWLPNGLHLMVRNPACYAGLSYFYAFGVQIHFYALGVHIQLAPGCLESFVSIRPRWQVRK